MRMITYYSSVAILSFAILSACSNHMMQQTASPSGISGDEPETPQILMLHFSAFQTSVGKDSLALTSATVVPGFLKEDMKEELQVIPAGKLRCTLMDMEDNPIKSMVIDYPLERSLELPPVSAEEGEYTHSRIRVEKEDFLVRARFSKNIKQVVVEKSDDKGNPDYRVKFELPVL